MNSTTDDGAGSIHPALQARISRVAAARQTEFIGISATALRSLAHTTATLRRVAEGTARLPEVARIASEVEPRLMLASASLQRWCGPEVPACDEMEAVAACLQVALDELNRARQLSVNSTPMGDQ